MGWLGNDLRVTARVLAKSQGSAALVVLVLAVGIGANTAVFSLVDGVVLRPLPYPGSERLVELWESAPAAGLGRFGVSPPAFRDWRTQGRAFAGLVAVTESSANLAGSDQPQRVRVARVAGDLGSVFGATPLLGRTFRPEEEEPGRDAVVVVTEEFWRSELAADAHVVGRTVTLDGIPHEIVGVLPSRVVFPFEGDQIFKPLALGAGSEDRGSRWLAVFGRLRPGTALPEAEAEMTVLARRHERAYPETNTGWTIEMEPLHEVMVAELRPTLVVLWAAVGFVLLVAAANVAALLMVRGVARQREMAVRAALGAGRSRIARLVLAEGALLALLGGAGGILLAWGLLRAVVRSMGEALPASIPAGLDPKALGFALTLSAVTGLLFSLLPALQAMRLDLDRVLRPAARGATGVASLRIRRAFVVAEMSLTVVLLVGAGLLARSLLRLLSVDPGFDSRRTLTLRVAPPQVQPAAGETEQAFMERYRKERDRVAGFYDALLAGLSRLPGVQAAGAVNRLPLTGRWWSEEIRVEGAPAAAPGQRPSAYGRVVSPGYFRAMGIPLRVGRDFSPFDTHDPVAVVSEAFARRHWPGLDPLGRRLSLDNPVGPWMTVVGVAGDVRVDGVEQEAKPLFYVPFRQATFGLFPDWGMDLVVRTTPAPVTLLAGVREEVRRLEPALPVFSVETLEARLAGSTTRRRAAAQLVGAFAGVAMLLAATGLASLVAVSVRLRTREMGVRAALGARPRDLVLLVLREGIVQAALGAGLGLLAAAAGGRLLGSLLYATSPLDLATFATVTGVLGLVSLLACYVPARRAGRLDPVVALRDE